MRIAIVVGALLAVLAAPGVAQEGHDYREHARWVGSFYAPEPGYGDPFGFYDIAYHEGRLYALTLWSGIYQLDFSDPGDLRLGDWLWFDYGAQDFALWDDHVYVRSYGQDIRILRIEPDGFVEVGLLETGPQYGPSDLATADGCLYATFWDHLSVYDLRSDPESPSLSWQLPLSAAGRSVTVDEGRLYLGTYSYNHDNAFVVVDAVATTPEPQTGAVFIDSYSLESTAVASGMAYVTGWSAGLTAVDVRVPAHPTIRRRWDLTGGGNAVAVAGSRAFVCAQDLLVVEVQGTEAIGAERWFRLPAPNQGAYEVTTVGDHVFVAEAGDQIAGMYRVGVQAYQVGDREPPPGPTATLALGGTAYLAARGEYACALTNEGLSLLSLDDDGQPAIAGFAGLEVAGATPRAVACDGDLAVALLSAPAPARLVVFDVGDPAAPQRRGALSFATTPLAAVIEGSRAYVVTLGRNLVVVSLEDPDSPVILSTTAGVGAGGVDVDGDLAAVADGYGGVKLLDVSDPASPEILGTLDTINQASHLRLSGDVLHVADGQYLVSIDVADPAQPVQLAAQDLAYPADALVLVDGLVYLTGKDQAALAGNCLQIVDSRAPAALRHLGHTALQDPGYTGVVAVDGWIVAACGSVVHVFPRQCDLDDDGGSAGAVAVAAAVAGGSLRISPNPANPRCGIEFILAAAGDVQIDIFDALGRRIVRLADGPFAAGASRVIWAGTDARGQPVSSGTYLARVRTTAGEVVRKLALVR